MKPLAPVAQFLVGLCPEDPFLVIITSHPCIYSYATMKGK